MSSSSSSLEARRQEILAKREKLAELKRQRAIRQREFTSTRQSGDAAELISPSPSRANSRADLDQLISTLVDRPGRSTPRDQDSPTTSANIGASRPNSISLDTPSTAGTPAPLSVPNQTLSFTAVSTLLNQPSDPKPDVITYSKGVQTSEPWSPQHNRQLSDDDSTYSPSRTRKRLGRRERERDEELRQNIRKEIEDELKSLKLSEDAATTNGKENFPARTLTHEELGAVTASDAFLDFIDRSTKVIERALDEDYDVLADYAMRGVNGLDDDEEDGPTRTTRGRRVRELMQFQDDRWTKRRMISDLDYSVKYPELLLASYTKASNSSQSAPGLALVWNAHMPSQPEYVFTATSDILTARFSPYHPSLVLGGTYSGQVCLWDIRQRSHDGAPVQRTPLAGEKGGHAHPIYSVAVVGTQNASSIVSVSTDGTTCAWSFDMLSKPQEYLELASPVGRNRTEDIAPSCISFPKADPTYFLAGTEEGAIVPVHRYDRAGAKAGVDPRVYYTGHAAPVTGLDFHPSKGKVDLGDLAISSSLDWSVKIWRVKPPSTAVTTAGVGTAAGSPEKPLLEIMREDVIYDVKWSPTKPGVFGCVDGAGRLEIFDINVDVEVPVARTQPSHTQGDVFGVKSLNRLAWEHNEGKRVAVGGLDGIATVFEVGSDLGGLEENNKGEDWFGVKRLISRLDRSRDGNDGR
ncbi:cytoplasmic dynein intermediate chain [Aureobasidium subglaciale]|nr:cytoplasmic dynein intermediate chain [Aureobasidium subglaciale]